MLSALRRLWHRVIGTGDVLHGRADYLEQEASRLMWRAATFSGSQPNPWRSADEAAAERSAAVALLARADQLLAQARDLREQAEDLVSGR